MNLELCWSVILSVHLPESSCLLWWCKLLEIALWNTGLQRMRTGTKHLSYSSFVSGKRIGRDWLATGSKCRRLKSYLSFSELILENDTEWWGKSKHQTITHIWLWLAKYLSNWSIAYFSGISYLWWVIVLLLIFFFTLGIMKTFSSLQSSVPVRLGYDWCPSIHKSL